MLRTLTLTLVGQNNVFYNEVLNISCNLLNVLVKVKNRMDVWITKNGSKCIPHDRFLLNPYHFHSSVKLKNCKLNHC